MKIAVCIKRVPDSETRVKIAADGKSLDEAGVKFVMNPYDEFAVEEALRRKEKAGSGEVAVICLGPAAAQETIRTALAMGADRGVLLQADKIPADPFEAARLIAAELKGASWDLILFGRMAIDDYNHQVGPVVAELLGMPCVTAISHLDIEGATGVAERRELVCSKLLPSCHRLSGKKERSSARGRGPSASWCGCCAKKPKSCDSRPRGARAA